jgi:hypothetical protein
MASAGGRAVGRQRRRPGSRPNYHGRSGSPGPATGREPRTAGSNWTAAVPSGRREHLQVVSSGVHDPRRIAVVADAAGRTHAPRPPSEAKRRPAIPSGAIAAAALNWRAGAAPKGASSPNQPGRVQGR